MVGLMGLPKSLFDCVIYFKDKHACIPLGKRSTHKNLHSQEHKSNLCYHRQQVCRGERHILHKLPMSRFNDYIHAIIFLEFTHKKKGDKSRKRGKTVSSYLNIVRGQNYSTSTRVFTRGAKILTVLA